MVAKPKAPKKFEIRSIKIESETFKKVKIACIKADIKITDFIHDAVVKHCQDVLKKN